MHLPPPVAWPSVCSKAVSLLLLIHCLLLLPLFVRVLCCSLICYVLSSFAMVGLECVIVVFPDHTQLIKHKNAMELECGRLSIFPGINVSKGKIGIIEIISTPRYV